jgi:hypothetical protein
MQRVTDQRACVGFGLFDPVGTERLRHVMERLGDRDA